MQITLNSLDLEFLEFRWYCTAYVYSSFYSQDSVGSPAVLNDPNFAVIL